MFTGCRHGETVLEYYPDGSRKASYSFLIADDSAKLRHGVQMTWYQDGSPESMELYRFGYREGNVLRWYPGGALKSKEHYAAGVRDPQTRYWNPRGDAFACGKPDEWDPGSGFWPHGPLGTDLCSRN
ncbi:MAG: hypothetical protein ABI036_00390 [Fibrobacteria bacterium]